MRFSQGTLFKPGDPRALALPVMAMAGCPVPACTQFADNAMLEKSLMTRFTLAVYWG